MNPFIKNNKSGLPAQAAKLKFWEFVGLMNFNFEKTRIKILQPSPALQTKTVKVKNKIDDDEINRIPQTGAFVAIANHPTGMKDFETIFETFLTVRPDFKILTDAKFSPDFKFDKNIFKVADLKSLTLPQNNFIRQQIRQHIANGKSFGIFPAGENAEFFLENGKRTEKVWIEQAIQYIVETAIPILPVFIDSRFNLTQQIYQNVFPLANNKEIVVRIGKIIEHKEFKTFESVEKINTYLRLKTHALGSKLKSQKFNINEFILVNKKLQEIVSPVSAIEIENEIERIREKHLLFNYQTYSVFASPASDIPVILNEIGRLREITFRQVGEGTNKAIDLDHYDLYYNHLFIWDNLAKCIVGAYRMGMGKEIMESFGKKGFYIHTLFKIKKEFLPVLQQSIELGRSFIVKEYQRKPFSLFLLWKGILYYLLKNEQYQYLIGPVSISNSFTLFSRSLIVQFIKKYCYNKEFAKFIKARKDFKVKKKTLQNSNTLVEFCKNDIKMLDKLINDIEVDLVAPVLLKKYISINAKIIGFNVDPKFNDCLDGLILLNLADIPGDVIFNLSKEMNNINIINRFSKN